MRIIAGAHKGRLLSFPSHIRPTQDKVRQAIFNVLSGVIKGSRVLDLFSGSGAMGLESLSRGAKMVYFIDEDKRCVSIIRRNLRQMGEDGRQGVFCYVNDAFRALKILSKKKVRFDCVFIDPPYHKDLAKKALKVIALGGILTPLGLVVVEHAKTDALDGAEEAYTLIKKMKYGDITVSVFQMR
ncbi:MAG: 16S rRNA (guanine(966)-N(2))-methyltransferase RsmD [Candidatus Omnitrophota bacterium]